MDIKLFGKMLGILVLTIVGISIFTDQTLIEAFHTVGDIKQTYEEKASETLLKLGNF